MNFQIKNSRISSRISSKHYGALFIISVSQNAVQTENRKSKFKKINPQNWNSKIEIRRKKINLELNVLFYLLRSCRRQKLNILSKFLKKNVFFLNSCSKSDSESFQTRNIIFSALRARFGSKLYSRFGWRNFRAKLSSKEKYLWKNMIKLFFLSLLLVLLSKKHGMKYCNVSSIQKLRIWNVNLGTWKQKFGMDGALNGSVFHMSSAQFPFRKHVVSDV